MQTMCKTLDERTKKCQTLVFVLSREQNVGRIRREQTVGKWFMENSSLGKMP